MSLTGLARALLGSGTGLFAYLAGRNENRNKVELEKARQEASAALISQLPDGAVFRESTPNGWREILMPPCQEARLIILPADAGQPACRPNSPDVFARQAPRVITEEDNPQPRRCPAIRRRVTQTCTARHRRDWIINTRSAADLAEVTKTSIRNPLTEPQAQGS